MPKKVGQARSGGKIQYERSDEMLERICLALIAHNGGIQTLCEEMREVKGFPSAPWISDWMRVDADVDKEITRAREEQMERIQTSSYKGMADLEVREEKHQVTHFNNVFNASVKLAGQMAPRKYRPGMKLDVDVGGDLADRLDAAIAELRKHQEG